MNKKEGTKRRVAASGKKAEAMRGGHSWFLGIGINTYGDKHFPDLKNAVADVEAMAAVLQERYDVTKVKLLLEKEATREHIIMELDRLEREVQAADKLIIFYAGHGHVNRANKGFWIPHDAKHTHSSQYLRNSTIRDYLESIASKHTLLIADSCFSGSLFTRGKARSSAAIAKLEQKASRWALCSGRHDELVDDGRGGGHSPFTSSILNILRENTAPKLNVGKVIDQVMELTTAKVEDQTPEGNPLRGVGHKGGQYVFVLRQDETVLWANIQEGHTFTVLLEYLEKYPAGQHREEVKHLLRQREKADQSAWLALGEEPSIAPMLEYLKMFPDGRFKDLVQQKIRNVSMGRWTQKDVFKDPRDSKEYRVVEYNDKTWLAQNLNYRIGGSSISNAFVQDQAGKHFGSFYSWEGAKKACPPGWHLPTAKEWQTLAETFGGYQLEERKQYNGNYREKIWAIMRSIRNWEPLFKEYKNIGQPEEGYSALVIGGYGGFDALLAGWEAYGKLRPAGDPRSRPGLEARFWTASRMGGRAVCFCFHDGKLKMQKKDPKERYSCRYVKN